MPTFKLATNQDLLSLHSVKSFLDQATFEKRIALQQSGNGEFILIFNNKQLKGFVLLKWHGKPTHPEYPDMEDLFVLEDARGKGYGTALILEREVRTNEKGYKKIGLAVNPTLNAQVHKLYTQLGYHHDGKKEYVDGIYDGVEDVVIDMEKNLNIV
jgi:GNAT superfamily N-acetyltransferase